MEQNQNIPTPEAATDEPASSSGPAAPPPGFEPPAFQPPTFEPVALRYRQDGLTPEKQRDYVEALADSGLVREAAARVGVSEQSVNRLRRRADAKSFNLACDAARRIGARRLHAIAWERAIEGTVKQHFYHGELKGEERVHDNRLLIHLLGKTEHLLAEPDEEARAVAGNWEPFVEALEQGLPPPVLSETESFAGSAEPDADEDEEEDDEPGFGGVEVWQAEGSWWTEFPPPAGFDGEEEGEPGDYDYKRRLTDAEQAVIDEDERSEREEEIARQSARRDLYFGFDGDAAGAGAEEEIFSSMEAEPSETSEPSARRRKGGAT